MEEHVSLTALSRSSNASEFSDRLGPPGRLNAATDRYVGRSYLFRIAWQDVKTITRLVIKHITPNFWAHLGLILVLIIALTSSGLLVVSTLIYYDQYCTPGGSFDIHQAYNPWAAEHTFQITLGFGHLTFPQAKAIDVVWDVVIGRGGQFFLTVICFQVFSKALHLRLEQPNASITYAGFRAIIFERPSLSSTSKLFRDFSSAKEWRSKASNIWMVAASIYVVAFPTMISAMTGYSSNVQAFFNDDTGDGKVKATGGRLHRAIYLITDADRIDGMNFSESYVVGSKGFGHWEDAPDFDYHLCLRSHDYYYSSYADKNGPSMEDDCVLMYAISDYIQTYSGNLPLATEKRLTFPNGTNFIVQPPGLTVKNFNTLDPADEYYYSNSGESYERLSTVNEQGPYMYTTTNSNKTYNETYINGGFATCDSQGTYQWGFSFILLFGFCVLTGVWALGMYIMWVNAFCVSRLDRAGRRMGFYRGVVDINNAMWKDMLRQPGELLPESKIKEMLAERLNGGRITFDEIDLDKLPPTRLHHFRQAIQSIPSVSGWTRTWTLLHWGWYVFFTLSGFMWFLYPLGAFLSNVTMNKFAEVFNLLITSICWLITSTMLLANIPSFSRFLYRITSSGLHFSPRELSHWAWTIFSAAMGALALLNAAVISGYYAYPDPGLIPSRSWYEVEDALIFPLFIINTFMAGIFWIVSAVQLLIGLGSTLWRWTIQLTTNVPLSWLGRGTVTLTRDSVSRSDQAANGSESD